MEAYIMLFTFLMLAIILWYLRPLISQRLKTKKVKVVLVSRNGERCTNTLYLYKNDPLWKVIKMHQGCVNEQ